MVGKVTPDTMSSASLLPAIMGLSPWDSPNDALDKVLGAHRGHPRAVLSDPEPADWGSLLEVTVLQQAALRLGITHLDLDHPKPRFHPLLKLACSLDGTADGNALLVKHNPDAGIYVMDADEIVLTGVGVMEAKCTSMDPVDSPPLYQGPIQLQAQMDIIGAQWGAVCTLFRGSRLRVFLFKRHAQTCSEIAKAVIDFQRRVNEWLVTGTIDYYPPTSSKDADRTWGQAQEIEVDLGLPAALLVDDIVVAKAEIKRFEEKVERAETNLKNLMRQASKAKAGSWEISWPMRQFKAQPERVVAATEARVVRQSTLKIKEARQ